MQSRFFRGRRLKGKVEKVWNNQTPKGKRYSVLQIDGEKYSLWDEAYFDRIQTGQIIEFDYQESGKYKNISKIYESSGAKKYPSMKCKIEIFSLSIFAFFVDKTSPLNYTKDQDEKFNERGYHYCWRQWDG